VIADDDALERLAKAVATAGERLLAPDRPRSGPGPTPVGELRVDAGLPVEQGLWVTVVSDASGARWTVPLAEEGDTVRRAVAGDGVAQALIALIAAGTHARRGFTVRAFAGRAVSGERAIAADQTNESIVVGDSAVVKWVVRLPPRGSRAVQPAARRLASLSAAGFDGAPTLWGLLTCDESDSAPLLLASVAAYLPDAADGWDWAVDDARRLSTGALSLDAALAPAAALGDLTARMHLAFASGGRTSATADQTERWTQRALDDLLEAGRIVEGPEGERLRAAIPRISDELATLAGFVGTPLIDVHGDFHVGQVLRFGSPPSYAVTDFDGNPVLSAEDRAELQPAAVDVAGMMASLDHVGRVVVRRAPDVDADRVLAWSRDAQDAFLAAYRDSLSRRGAGDLLQGEMLRPLRFRQECREFLYAVRHLPHWRYVPDGSLAALLEEE
jgi:maltokinase